MRFGRRFSAQQMFPCFATWPIKTTECTCEIHTKLNTYARVKRIGFFIKRNSHLALIKLRKKINSDLVTASSTRVTNVLRYSSRCFAQVWAQIHLLWSVIFRGYFGPVQLFSLVPVKKIFRLYRQTNKTILSETSLFLGFKLAREFCLARYTLHVISITVDLLYRNQPKLATLSFPDPKSRHPRFKEKFYLSEIQTFVGGLSCKPLFLNPVAGFIGLW